MSLALFYEAYYSNAQSSIGLGFLNPTYQLKRMMIKPQSNLTILVSLQIVLEKQDQFQTVLPQLNQTSKPFN